MTDTISAPASDRCAFPNCGLPESASHGSHVFVRPGQLRIKEPYDPLKVVRQMTDEEKARSTERSVTFVQTTAVPKVRPKAAEKLTQEERSVVARVAAEKRWARDKKPAPPPRNYANDDPRKCDICGKEKTRHRGRIGHGFVKFNAEPPKAVANKPPCIECGGQPGAHRGRHAARLGHLYRADPDATIVIPDVRKMVMEDGVDLGPVPVKSRAAKEPAATDIQIPSVAAEPDFPSIERLDPGACGRARMRTEPVLRTRAMIMDAVERALQSIDIGSHVRLDDTRLVTESSIDNDANIIAAEITAKFSIVFPTRQEEP